jgi:hypothetical protein
MILFRNRRAEYAEGLFERAKDGWRVELDNIRAEHWKNVEVLVQAHREHIAAIEALHNSIELQSVTGYAEMKTAHARELNRVIDENRKLQDDMDRLRLLLTPALQNVELPKERTAPPPPSEVITGTPWQRVLQREIAAQERAAARKMTQPADVPLEGESHGSRSERRVDAPLSGKS